MALNGKTIVEIIFFAWLLAMLLVGMRCAGIDERIKKHWPTIKFYWNLHCLTRASFRRALAPYLEMDYAQVCQLSVHLQKFLFSPEFGAFLHAEGMMRWRYHVNRGGSVAIPGIKNRANALLYVGQNLKGLTVINVDTLHGFIFLRPNED